MTPNWIELEGAHNARDMGGLPTPAGPTRSGVLLRSDALDALTAGDVQRLVEVVGLAHVVDLRSGSEREQHGRGPLGDTAVRYTEVAVITPADIDRRRQERIAEHASGRSPDEIMSAGYVNFLDIGAHAFVEAFDRIVAPGGTPALVHCAAGKDRTGVLIALLLDVVGVDRAVIAADYAATNERMAPIVARLGAAASYERTESVYPAFVMEAIVETMERFVDHLHREWDGAAGFLGAHGVTAVALDRWRSLFVDTTTT